MTSSLETVLCQYHYDPLDRLTSHALTNTPKRQRFYFKSRLATEIQGTMCYSIVQQGDQLLAQQRSDGDQLDATLLATDQQRSVVQTLKANHPPQPIAYSPYGHRSIDNELLSLLGFNGERPDPVTRCYLLGNGYRAFNPVLMRFISPDSLSPFGKGGLNPYAYCAGEPILGSDPTGHWNIGSAWKGLKNLFGRTPRKFRTSTPAAAQRTADLPNSQASSNTARKYSSSSSPLLEQLGEFIIPRPKLNLRTIEPKPKTSIIQEHGIATPQELLKPHATNSPRNPPKPPITTSPRNQARPLFMTSPESPPVQVSSRAELERILETNHTTKQMRAFMAGDKNAFNKSFNLSDHASYIREMGF